MSYIIGYVGVPFLIAFLIVHFGIKNNYVKKHNNSMGAGKEVAWTIGLGIVFLFISLIGGVV